jgi:Rps23 Pro-64 3,4-dihydroxylase Tpa1-like proline 4-hydroxylase
MESKLKRKAVEPVDTYKKKSRIEEEKSVVAELNVAYQSADFLEKITGCWGTKGTLSDDTTGVILYSHPYQLCVLPQFISSSKVDFLQQLSDEVLRLKFVEKNNDLYQFRQSDDLKKFKSLCITAFRHVLQNECLPWLRQVTGIELNNHIDITCSKYEFTDHLLCHDDQLEGRRIAFIFYLISHWTSDDGGTLDMFDSDVTGAPSQVAVSILPVWNNFVFFEVTPASFHQVSEVLSAAKTRLSISGWFHGPDVSRPTPALLPGPVMSDPVLADLSTLSDWVNPCYLDIGTHSQVQSQFEVDSQIELPDFLLEERYGALCEELKSQHCKWTLTGPPNKRHVHLAERQSLPPTITAFLEFLHSEPFCRLLSHLTGLDLAENVIRCDGTGEGKEQPCSSMSNEHRENEGMSQVESSSSKGKGAVGQETGLLNGSGKHLQTNPKTHPIHKQGLSSAGSCIQSDETVDLSLPDADTSVACHNDPCSCVTVSPSEPATVHHRVAKISGELLCFQPGDYTLVTDHDLAATGDCVLDLLLHFCCDDWSVDCGGMRVYVAKDEEEELLSVSPSRNALSLVFCEQDTLSFTKYINHRNGCTDNSNFFTTYFTYQEIISDCAGL